MQQQQLIAGDSLNFSTATPDYPASAGWVLKYRLVPRGAGTPIDLTAVAEGDDHRIAVAAAVTANWTAGEYGWAAWVEGGAAEKYTVEQGQLTVRPDPRAVAAGTDLRSESERALADLRTALAQWTPLKRRYRIGDREIEFNSTADIIKLITWWEQQVSVERQLDGRAEKPSRRIYTRL